MSLRSLVRRSSVFGFAAWCAIAGAQTPVPSPSPATPTPVPVVTVQDLQNTWETFSQTLFGPVYDPMVTKFSLAQTVDAVGTFAGLNQDGIAWTLDVSSAVNLDFQQMGLPRAERLEALRTHLTCSIVEATATSATGSLPVRGMALSRYALDIPFESTFVPLTLPAVVAPLTAGGGPGLATPFAFCVIVPIFCNPDPVGCEAACKAAYDAAKAAAEAAANLAAANEAVTHQTNMTTLGNNLSGALALADANYASQMKNCALLGVGGSIASFALGFVTLGIGLAGLGATATALAACQLDAMNSRDTAKNEANSAYDVGAANEQARYDGALQIINNNLQAALDAAQAALDACQAGCWAVCDWFIWCWWNY